MKNYWSTMFVGFLLGVSVTMLCTSKEKKLTRARRKVKARSKKAMNFVKDISQETGTLIGEQI